MRVTQQRSTKALCIRCYRCRFCNQTSLKAGKFENVEVSPPAVIGRPFFFFFERMCKISPLIWKKNSRDPLLIWKVSHVLLSCDLENWRDGWKACVLSGWGCGWMIISAVLLSNQRLLIHLTVEINKAGQSGDVCACVCTREKERKYRKCFRVAWNCGDSLMGFCCLVPHWSRH